jgi:hypothetical protein
MGEWTVAGANHSRAPIQQNPLTITCQALDSDVVENSMNSELLQTSANLSPAKALQYAKPGSDE